MKDERPRLTIFSNTEKRVENTTRSGEVLSNFEVFGNVVKVIEKLISAINIKLQTKSASFWRACAETPSCVDIVTCALSPCICFTIEVLLSSRKISNFCNWNKRDTGY